MFHSIHWSFSISISLKTFQSVNVPLSLFSIFMDIFFIFCLSPVSEQQRLKPPLLVLLGSLVGCNTALHFFTLLFVLSDFANSLSETDSYSFYYFTAQCLLFTMRVSITSCLWLNVFYYCQIVPARHPFLIMLKRNIRLFVYSALIIDKFFFLEEFIVYIASYLIRLYRKPEIYNSTYTNMVTNALIVDIWLRLVYFFFSVCMMLASGCATISYLRRHMRNMEKSSRSSARLQSQLRVTITGIIQTLLYLLCSVWLILDDVAFYLTTADFDQKAYIFYTVISLYSFGTNINLGVGQTVFREQAILIWQKLFGSFLD
ncbi:taste receptor type 2 member 1 [Astyanax mexicanus]|uniref:taste receptor type 2 member 1 n=1 Tax=Astyanax mexicanus TaxID=7994 RepID=UPI000BBD7100|nr:taste receptor type 2 member 1 [Astyanax mexicanus]